MRNIAVVLSWVDLSLEDLSPYLAGVGFLGCDAVLLIVVHIVWSCTQVTFIFSHFFLPPTVLEIQESKCLLSGWGSWASCTSVPVQSLSGNSLCRRSGSVYKLCIPAPYCLCVLFLLAVQIMSWRKGSLLILFVRLGEKHHAAVQPK